jgi:hypothetical protein
MLVAVDPKTLKILDSVEMPEPSSVPHSITTFDGETAIYAVAEEHALRYFWDPASKKLTQDPSWVVPYLDPGQTNGAAPAIMGDWIVIQTNGAPPSRSKASSLVAINQKDPSRVTKVFPFGQLEPGQQSFAPPKIGSDAENNMVYSQDLGFGKVAGVKLDQATGELKTVFVVDDRTTCLAALIGPKEKRVMLTSNQDHDFPFEPMMLALGTGLYREQVRWRDATTGRLIAESDLMDPMSVNTAVTPGFGGGSITRPTADLWSCNLSRRCSLNRRPRRRQALAAAAPTNRTSTTHAFSPKFAFLRFPLVQRADLEGRVRVDCTHLGRRRGMAHICAASLRPSSPGTASHLTRRARRGTDWCEDVP